MTILKAILTPIVFGLATYMVSALGLWFIFSLLLIPFQESMMLLLPAVAILIPLFLSGYVAGRYTMSIHQPLKITFGVVPGVIGFGLTQWLTFVQEGADHTWFLLLLFLCAAIVAGIGAYFSPRVKATFS